MIYKEYITPHQKKFFHTYNFEILDELEIGDYTLVLLKNPESMEEYEYQIAIQRKGYDFTNPSDQMSKLNFPPDLTIIKPMMNKIKEWLSKYKEIAIGSYDKRKERIYERIFNKFGIKIKNLGIYKAIYSESIKNQPWWVLYHFPFITIKFPSNDVWRYEIKERGQFSLIKKLYNHTPGKLANYLKSKYDGSKVELNPYLMESHTLLEMPYINFHNVDFDFEFESFISNEDVIDFLRDIFSGVEVEDKYGNKIVLNSMEDKHEFAETLKNSYMFRLMVNSMFTDNEKKLLNILLRIY